MIAQEEPHRVAPRFCFMLEHRHLFVHFHPLLVDLHREASLGALKALERAARFTGWGWLSGSWVGLT